MLARRQCHTADAGDVAHEVFVRLGKIFATGRPAGDAPPFAYVCGVARNVARELCRQGERPMEPVEHAELVVPPPTGPVLECHQRCLLTLHEHERRLLIQYTLATSEERGTLATRLGISLNALRVRINALRQRLRRCVEGCLAGEGARS